MRMIATESLDIDFLGGRIDHGFGAILSGNLAEHVVLFVFHATNNAQPLADFKPYFRKLSQSYFFLRLMNLANGWALGCFFGLGTSSLLVQLV